MSDKDRLIKFDFPDYVSSIAQTMGKEFESYDEEFIQGLVGKTVRLSYYVPVASDNEIQVKQSIVERLIIGFTKSCYFDKYGQRFDAYSLMISDGSSVDLYKSVEISNIERS